MIGLKITEKEYRDLDDLSYSLLSSVNYMGSAAIGRKFVPTMATKFGILTESMLFGDYNPDDYYVIKETMPDSKLKDACDFMFPLLVEENKAEQDNLLKNSLYKLKDYISKFLTNYHIDYYLKRTVESRTDSICTDESAQNYWRQFIDSQGLITISQEMLIRAKECVNTLKSHKFTASIFAEDSFFNVEKYSQVKLQFKYLGLNFKCMLDWLIIDHDNKIIRPYDLKTGGKSVERFPDSFYYWRYDIQAYLYTEALYQWKKINYPDYNIDIFKFVYISRDDAHRPLVWKPTNSQLLGTKVGFKRDKEYYKGVDELIKEYLWYVKNEGVQYSKEVYDNDGEMYIKDEIEINGK